MIDYLKHQDYNKIKEVILRKKTTLVQFTRQLIRIPTETRPPRGNEKPGQEFIIEKLKGLGLKVDVFEPTDVQGITRRPEWCPGFQYRNRPNVVGILKGCGQGPSLILNGHMDVMRAGEREKWNFDPYAATMKDGKIIGRGAADMKAGIAGMIVALECIIEAGYTLKGKVIVESVVDEEQGGFNGTLACCMRGYEANAAVIAEPTGLKISPATKGAQAYRITTRGKSAHISLWQKGISALDKAIQVREAVKSFEKIRTKEHKGHSLYQNREIFPAPVRYDTIFYLSSGDKESYSVPDKATIYLMIEECPGQNFDDILKRFEEHILKECSLDPFLEMHPPKIERVSRTIYPTQIDLQHAIISAVSRAYQSVVGNPAVICGFESECDASIFNCYTDTPCLVFGPGNPGVCHAPNEYIEIDELVKFAQIMAISIMEYCGYEGCE